jgi:hypothetical protein
MRNEMDCFGARSFLAPSYDINPLVMPEAQSARAASISGCSANVAASGV